MDTIKSPYLDNEALELEVLDEENQGSTKPLNSPFLTHELLVEDELNESEHFDEDWEAEVSDYDAFGEETEFDNETFFEGEGNVDEYQEEYIDDFQSEYLDYEGINEEDLSDMNSEQEEYNDTIDLAQEISNEAFTSNSFHDEEVETERFDNFNSEIELEELVDDEIDIQGYTLEETHATKNTKGEGLSSIAKQSDKRWDASKNRPSKWIGNVYGLVVHTTGGSLPGRAIKNGRYPTSQAVDWYTRGRRKKSFHGGCHYINGWQGLEGGDLLQIANEREKAWGVSTTKQRKSINNKRFEKDLPSSLVGHWKKRWAKYSSSLELLPGNERYANNCYIHVECTPVYYYINKKAIISKEFPPMRPGLRFTKAQHDAIAYLACDIAIRNGWSLGENWWRTPRLLGHEDLTPITRKDKHGGWDPGGLRDRPYFDWDYVYTKIEEIKNNGYKLPGQNPINYGGGFLGNILNKGKALVGSIFNKGNLMSVALATISKGEKDENKITNAVFYAKYPDRRGEKLQPNDPLVSDWIAMRNTITRPLLRNLKTDNETSLIDGQTASNHNVPEVEMGIWDAIFDHKAMLNKWSEAVKKVQSIAAKLKAMTFLGLRNIPGQHSNGFVDIMVKQSNGGYKREPLSLHSRVKDVSFYYSKKRVLREKFTLLDYPHSGKEGTVRALNTKESRFGKSLYGKGAVVRFNESTHKLTIDNYPGFEATAGSMADPTSDKLPKLGKGTYKLLIPAYTATFGTSYTSLTPYARAWFQIEDAYVGSKKGRYLHPGKTSHSCITIGENNPNNPNNASGTNVDIKKWSQIYQFLIRSRINNKYVGELVIT